MLYQSSNMRSDDKIISAKEAFTKEGTFEPESGRQTRQARQVKNAASDEFVDEMPTDVPYKLEENE